MLARTPLATTVDALDTPRLLVDVTRLDDNIRRMHEAVAAHGVGLRSHIKTHKSVELARMQIAAGSIGIATAKVSEAEVFVDAGIEDVVVAYPIVGEAKGDAVCRLAKRCRLTVHADSREGIEGLRAAASRNGVTLRVRLDIDSGLRRTGVAPANAFPLAAEIAQADELEFDGVTTHRSAFFAGANGQPAGTLGRKEGELIAAVADALRERGLDVPNVVAGSTPTALGVAATPGISEVCAGTYSFYDWGMTDRGFGSPEQIALSVLTTIVSVRDDGRVTVDAGSKTLSKDSYGMGAPSTYGVLGEHAGQVESVTEEHGLVRLEPGHDRRVGDRLRIFPIHVCPVVNLADELVAVDGAQVVDCWTVDARGKVR